VMKPKPLESLNHLTVPVAISVLPFAEAATKPGAAKTGHDDQREVNCTATRNVLRTTVRGAISLVLDPLRGHDITISIALAQRRTGPFL